MLVFLLDLFCRSGLVNVNYIVWAAQSHEYWIGAKYFDLLELEGFQNAFHLDLSLKGRGLAAQ